MPDGVAAAADLAGALLSLRPLTDVLDAPARAVTAPAAGGAGLQALLDALAARLGTPRLTLGAAPAGGGSDVFARVLAERLGEPLERAAAAGAGRLEPAALDAAAAGAWSASFAARRPRVEVRSFDGAPLHAYAAGAPERPAVVLASACGMPAALCDRWMERLAREHRVVTWESRGLFAHDPGFDRRDSGPTAQSADLVAVMDALGIASAHVMGLCGGAVIALAAAAAEPLRVRSISLWHGDYDLGPGCPRTDHQHDLAALMAIAAESRAGAASVRAAVCRTIAARPLPDPAHLVLYPWTGDELLHRYGRLNGALMTADVEALLDRVGQPATVVTSEDDATAHPAGSERVAERLRGGTLFVEPHGDHLSLFRAEPNVARLAALALGGEPVSAARPSSAARLSPAAC